MGFPRDFNFRLRQYSSRTRPAIPSFVFYFLAIALTFIQTNQINTATAMRLVIQRVKSASVTVDNTQVSAIGPGILALVGLHIEDTDSDLQYCAKRLLACKLWENASGAPWRQHVKQKEYEILCVSQFTLYGTLSKKSQPDYKLAMKSQQAQDMYGKFLDMLKEGYEGDKIFDGKFGEMMDVGLVNDGPVTLVIDSRDGMLSTQSSAISSDGNGSEANSS